MSVARYGATSGGSYRRGPRRYVPAAVGHSGRCIVLQNFSHTIYFCKIEIEKIKKFFITPSRVAITRHKFIRPPTGHIDFFIFYIYFFTISKKYISD
jgi:hypothetical protein